MNKVFGQTLIDDMARAQSIPVPQLKEAAREILAVIREGLIRDGVVKVSNFGTFRLKPMAARRGINPRTGEAIVIPAQKRVIFSPCKALRDLIQPVYEPPVPIAPDTTSPEDSPEEPAGAARRAGETTSEETDKPASIAAMQLAETRISAPLTTQQDTQQPVSPVATSSWQAADEPQHPEEAPYSAPLPLTDSETAPTPVPEPEPQHPEKAPYSTPLPLSDSETAPTPVPEPEPPQQQTAPPIEPHTRPPEENRETDSDVEADKASLHEETESASQPEAVRPEQTTTSAPFPQTAKIRAEDTSHRSNRYYAVPVALLLLVTFIGAGLFIESDESEDAPTPSVAVLSPAASEAADTNTGLKEQASEKVTTSISVIQTTPQTEMPPPSQALKTTPHEDDTEQPGITEARSNANSGEVAAPMENSAQSASGASALSETQTHFFTEQSHKVHRGESLWRLARHHYRDPLLWPHIYQANTSVIEDPDYLLVGSTVTLPGLEGSPERLTKGDRRHIAEGYYLAYLHYKENGRRQDAFFALMEAKRYDSSVVEEHINMIQLSKAEELELAQQESMPF